MPSPRYIICCETQILDRSTGSVSHINVFDGFTVVKSQEGEQLKLTGSETLFPKFIASAVWAEDDDDVKGAEYDWEFRTHAPNREPRSGRETGGAASVSQGDSREGVRLWTDLNPPFVPTISMWIRW